MTLRAKLIAAQTPLFAALASVGILFYVALAASVPNPRRF